MLVPVRTGDGDDDDDDGDGDGDGGDGDGDGDGDDDDDDDDDDVFNRGSHTEDLGHIGPTSHSADHQGP